MLRIHTLALCMGLFFSVTASAAVVHVTGRATVSEVFQFTPPLLAEVPVVGDMATFSLSYADDSFGADGNSEPNVGSYMTSGASRFVVDFGAKGFFTTELAGIDVSSASNGNPLSEAWSLRGDRVVFQGHTWTVSLELQENDTDRFPDDQLRTLVDPVPFLLDQSPDTITFTDIFPPFVGEYRLDIDRMFIPEPSALTAVGLGLLGLAMMNTWRYNLNRSGEAR